MKLRWFFGFFGALFAIAVGAITTVGVPTNLNLNSLTIKGVPITPTVITCTTTCSGAALTVGQTIVVTKTGTTSRASVTALALDPDLSVTALPSGTYYYSLSLIYAGGTGGGFAGNIHSTGSVVSPSTGYAAIAPGGPGAGCGTQSLNFGGITATTVSATALTCAAAATTAGQMLIPNTAMVLSTSGDISLTWAQSSSSATASTTNPGSVLTVQRVN